MYLPKKHTKVCITEEIDMFDLHIEHTAIHYIEDNTVQFDVTNDFIFVQKRFKQTTYDSKIIVKYNFDSIVHLYNTSGLRRSRTNNCWRCLRRQFVCRRVGQEGERCWCRRVEWGRRWGHRGHRRRARAPG